MKGFERASGGEIRTGITSCVWAGMLALGGGVTLAPQAGWAQAVCVSVPAIGAVATGAYAFACGPNATAVGENSTAVGANAGLGADPDNSGNSAFGSYAGVSVTGSNNTTTGFYSGYTMTGNNNTAAGAAAGYGMEGSHNTATGFYAGYFMAGSENTATGYLAGYAVTGHKNVATGVNAGYFTSGSENIATGHSAGSNVTGDGNVATGSNSGADVAGDYNTAAGWGAGSAVAGSENTAMGFLAGQDLNGDGNTAIGTEAGRFVDGDGNIATGQAAGYNVLGNRNVATGLSAGQGIIGDDNVALGTRAGSASGFGTLAISRTVALGADSLAGFDGSMALGAGVETTRINQVAIGSASNTYTLAGIGSLDSVSAQTGETYVVTADTGGNLATSGFTVQQVQNAMTSVASLDGRVGSLESNLAALGGEIAATRQEAREGVAAAIAMSNAPMPSVAGRTAWAMNVGHFNGATALGGSLAYRFETPMMLGVTLGYSYAGESHAARLGLMGEF